jgi:hypothetical protein
LASTAGRIDFASRGAAFFATSGVAVSQLWHLAEAPVSTDTLEQWDNRTEFGGTGQYFRIYGEQSHLTGNSDAATTLLVMPNGSTSFVNDGTNLDCRLRTTLTGNGHSTPMVYGATVAFKTVTADTDNSEQYDATAFVVEASLEVPDGADGEKFRFSVIDDSGGTLSTHVHGLKTQYNRPILAQIGTTHIHNGRTGVPSYRTNENSRRRRDLFRMSDDHQSALRTTCSERLWLPMVLPTMPRFEERGCVIRRLLHLVGVPDAAIDIETSTVSVGDIAPEECGNWSDTEVGSNAWEVLCRFMDDYRRLALWDEADGIRNQIRS